MFWVLDSNILIRLPHRPDPLNPLIRQALGRLWARGDRFCYTSQILGEMWTVCTRPTTARGGFGLTLAETDRRVRLIERFYRRLSDTDAVHTAWRRLLVAHGVAGVQVHDARIVATMNVHAITHILTFNVADFARYPGITAVHPQDV